MTAEKDPHPADDAVLVPATARDLSRTFALGPLEDRLDTGNPISLDEVRQYLIEQITQMLDHNMTMLLSILYRIDVAEHHVKRVLTHSPPENIPGDLADLIIERQLQKVRMRRRFRGEEG